MPAGVVNLLAGAGEVGAKIVADERVDCVAFTGSVETGKAIARVCADRIARINLELGGKDPFIVCEDVAASVEVAARGGAWAAYLNAGQVCTSAERFYVMEPVYDDFLQAFVDHTETLRRRRPARPRHRHRADGLRRQRAQGVGAGRGGRRPPARRSCAAATAPGRPRPLLLARDRHRRARGDRPPARGDLRARGADRAGELARRGDRAGELDPLRPRRERLHARPRDGRPLHARDQGGARSGSTTRSPTTTRGRSAA